MAGGWQLKSHRQASKMVAASLVSKFHEFSPEVLTSLGHVAVGISVSQIELGIRNVSASLPFLAKVRGWKTHQAEAILRKLFYSGYQIQDGRSLAALGSLVVGLDHNRLQGVPPDTVLDALQVPGFATQLEHLSPPQKAVFVEKAAVFFDDVIKTVHNFSSLCSSILHGFTCTAASNLDTVRLQELAKVMKEKKVHLGKDQLLCLVDRLMLHNVSHDFNDYPEDLVLFVSPSDYGTIGSCKEYFARVGKANIDVLEKGSSQRKQLLAEALDCLKISGPHVSRENAEILGRLACDLSAKYFKTSGKNLLKQLPECRSFSPDQVKAIQAVLCSGNTPLGPPSEWTPSTLEELGSLFLIFDRCILEKIPRSVLMPRLKCFQRKPHLPRNDLATLVRKLPSPRFRRSSDSECAPGKREVNDTIAQDESLLLEYTDKELDACLDKDVLKRNLKYLSSFPWTKDLLRKKLNETGYPDSVLRDLGELLSYMDPEDIKMWKFNSSETLASLLENVPSPEKAAAIIHQYTDSGGPLDAAALNVIGTEYICLLDSDQLKKIDENAINGTKSLDPSSCNQTTKDILYAKAKRAFSDRHNPPQYYDLIKPYLGGAPGVDLRALSKDGVDMDISTFMGLNKCAILDLKSSDVEGLLGRNLPDLKNKENESPVKDWIARQKQSELDQLGIGLRGGTPGGYINITPINKRPPKTSGAADALSLHLFPSLLLTLSLSAFLS
ncbi:mesothelin [Heteronotia binoei]|uniref:mesothelin n=1 Tax=Heteronotia binoei TaxID=13085 RepID=UPI002931B56E|nr:mesothelin [Heteronotia binoei]